MRAIALLLTVTGLAHAQSPLTTYADGFLQPYGRTDPKVDYTVTVKDASEVRDLNRRQRNKMAIVKEGLEVHEVLVQEGVHTFETVNEAVAEPVVYMIDRFVVGGFYRVHAQRGKDENLNAPGAQFVPLAFEAPCIPDLSGPPGCPPNRFYSYGVVARLAQLAAAIEVEELAVDEEAVPA